MNVYDAWIHKDGVFESAKTKSKVKKEEEVDEESAESDDNWCPRKKTRR